MNTENFRWQLGDKVRKKRGSQWRGTVCGFYSTPHTPEGYCVDSAFEHGSVQVWPLAALEDWDGTDSIETLEADLERIRELFGDAAQSDCENGVKWLNERAAAEYLKDFPDTLDAIRQTQTIIDAALAGKAEQ